MPIFDLRYISNDLLSGAISSSFKYVPSNPREIEKRGELHGLITVIGVDGVQADRIAKFVWDSIVDSYFYAPFPSVIDTLKKTIQEGSKKAFDLIKNDKGAEVNLSFSLAVFKGKGAYLAVYGEQELYMFKNGGIVKVSEVITQNKGVIVSIAWTDNDLVLMSSPNLLSSVTQSINIGDSEDEVIKNIESSSYNFSGYQSILVLTGKEPKRQRIDPIVRKELVQQTVFQEEKARPIVQDTIDQAISKELHNGSKNDLDNEEITNNISPNPDFDTKKLQKQKLHIDIGSYIVFFKKMFPKVLNILSKVIPFLTGIVNKIDDFLTPIFGKIRESLKGLYGNKHWYRSIMSKLSLNSSGRGNIKIDGYKEVGLRNKRFVILFLVVILAIIVFFGAKLSMNAKMSRDIHKQASVQMDQLENDLDVVQKNILDSPDEVAITLSDLSVSISQLSSLKLSLDDSKRFATLKSKYMGLDDRLNRRVGLSEDSKNISLFIDGRAEFGSTANLTDLTFYMDEFQNTFLLVVEKSDSVVYKINLDTKKIDRIPDSKNILKKPTFIDYGVGGIYVFDEARGVVKASFGKGGTIGNLLPVAGLDNDVVGDISVEDFAIITSSDNVYFLSNSEKAILKANRSGNGYSLPFNFITSKTFANAHNLANDVNIYALTQGEKGIERYAYNYTKRKTTLVPVTTVDLIPDFGEIVAGYTGSLKDSELFVFDKTNERLVMLEKPIESGQDSRHPNQMVTRSQFVYRGDRNDVFKDVKELAADYNDEFVYVLDGNQIWKVKVK